MTGPYTPATENVRLGYAYRPNLPEGERHHQPLLDEFDRWLEAHDREVRREALLSAAERLRKRSDSLFKAGERMWAMSDYGRRDTFDCRTGERGLQACGWSGQMNRAARVLEHLAARR